MKVRFCGDCKRLILADFSYCPYCGAVLPRGPELADSLETPFAKIERLGARLSVDHRIDELEATLDRIEVELELMLTSRHEN